jgi:hypothetical protein
MVRGQQEGVVRWAWPTEACEIYDHEDYRGDLRLTYALAALPTALVVGILDTIRNRVFEFRLRNGNNRRFSRRGNSIGGIEKSDYCQNHTKLSTPGKRSEPACINICG